MLAKTKACPNLQSPRSYKYSNIISKYECDENSFPTNQLTPSDIKTVKCCEGWIKIEHTKSLNLFVHSPP